MFLLLSGLGVVMLLLKRHCFCLAVFDMSQNVFCNIGKLYFARLICCLGMSVSLFTG